MQKDAEGSWGFELLDVPRKGGAVDRNRVCRVAAARQRNLSSDTLGGQAVAPKKEEDEGVAVKDKIVSVDGTPAADSATLAKLLEGKERATLGVIRAKASTLAMDDAGDAATGIGTKTAAAAKPHASAAAKGIAAAGSAAAGAAAGAAVGAAAAVDEATTRARAATEDAITSAAAAVEDATSAVMAAAPKLNAPSLNAPKLDAPALAVLWQGVGAAWAAFAALAGAMQVQQHVERAIFVAAQLAKSALLPRHAWLWASPPLSRGATGFPAEALSQPCGRPKVAQFPTFNTQVQLRILVSLWQVLGSPACVTPCYLACY